MIRFDNNDFIPGADSGSMVFWGGNSNAFKCDIKYFSFDSEGSQQPMIASNHLVSDEFQVSLRFYVKPDGNVRTPSFNMQVLGTDNVVYSISGVDWGCDVESCVDNWSTRSLNASSRFNIFPGNISGRTCPDGGAYAGCDQRVAGFDASIGASMQTWFEGAYSNAMFGEGASVVAVGLNQGSYQNLCYFGFDWIEASVYLGGQRVHFNAPGTLSEVPAAPNFPSVSSVADEEQQFQVSWNIPNDGDESISGYVVQCISLDGGGVRTATVHGRTETSRLIGNCGSDTANGPLVSGATYNCRVIAVSSAGSSGQSQPSLPFTIP